MEKHSQAIGGANCENRLFPDSAAMKNTAFTKVIRRELAQAVGKGDFFHDKHVRCYNE